MSEFDFLDCPVEVVVAEPFCDPSEKLLPLSNREIFDAFQFEGLFPEARAMFEDKATCHNFTVRGQSYLTDKLKVDPGPSMLKMMLLELYEVEEKDGGRHDHIANRGIAKTRVETLRNLPGNPFILVINYQIPGDPPVSMVAYFALPPDLLERYPGEDTEKFLKMFHRFVDIPKTEEERLACWRTPEPCTPEDLLFETGLESEDGGDVSPCTARSEGSITPTRASTPTPTHTSNTQPNTPRATSSPGTAVNAAASAVGGWFQAGSVGASWFQSSVSNVQALQAQIPKDIIWPTAEEPGVLPPTDFRNCRFKLYPVVTEGPWIVRAAVRSRPVLLGHKVVQRYFSGPGYMEIDVHIGSSVIANQIISVCRGYGKQFSTDIAVIIQGDAEDELPERLLACGTLNRVDMDVRVKLD